MTFVRLARRASVRSSSRAPRRYLREDPGAIRATPLVAIRHAAGVGHRRKVEINMRSLIAPWLRCRVRLPGAEERRSRLTLKLPQTVTATETSTL